MTLNIVVEIIALCMCSVMLKFRFCSAYQGPMIQSSAVGIQKEQRRMKVLCGGVLWDYPV